MKKLLLIFLIGMQIVTKTVDGRLIDSQPKMRRNPMLNEEEQERLLVMQKFAKRLEKSTINTNDMPFFKKFKKIACFPCGCVLKVFKICGFLEKGDFGILRYGAKEKFDQTDLICVCCPMACSSCLKEGRPCLGCCALFAEPCCTLCRLSVREEEDEGDHPCCPITITSIDNLTPEDPLYWELLVGLNALAECVSYPCSTCCDHFHEYLDE